jgi:TolB-like protein/tetratricopeptide (TPR) repeat protein
VIGQTLSHYRVERRLGAGGMGEVFLARDLALGRPAAIKLLAQPVDRELRSRLRREAEACARLQHPAIATFYEAGEENETVFLAMEFVGGETLRDRLERGPLPRPQAIAVTACLLEALNHAHAAGVLHRDIKPENVMVTPGGLAKLLDFGIARLLGPQEAAPEERTGTALTAVGAVVGTIGYMSPEQLKGQPLDERSDVFSLGAVLYEMLSGARAFPGDSVAEIIASVLSAAPTPRLAATAAADLNAVLDRALARDPSRRYPSAAAFLADLRAAASGEFVAVLPDSIAVVDFENLSKDPADDWIGSGIAESLSADLSRVAGLAVVPRGKMLSVRARLDATERESEAASLGRLLACRWVLSGGYQRVGPNLRITAQLTDVATGEAAAGEKLDGTLDGIFGMQDALAAAVARRLGPGAAAPAPAAPPPIDAFERHARGRRLFLQLEKGSMDQARLLFEQAIGAHPGYAPALAGLASVHAMRFTFMTDPAELETCAGYARRAIDADPELAEPRVWLGYVLFRQGRPDEAFAQERRAMELDPANSYAPYFAGCALGMFGRQGEALALFQRGLAIEPGHIWGWLGLGWMHLDLGAGSEAIFCLEKALELERLQGPHRTAGVAGYLGECLRRLGDPAGARARCLEGLEAVEKSDNMYRDTFRGVCLCALGRSALDAGDAETARVAFHQAAAHLRGRPRTLGGGYLVIQALAGLARAGEGAPPLEEALDLWRSRAGHDFSLMWSCTPDVTREELSAAAAHLGRPPVEN